jgi:hypothetical protein
MGQIKNEDFREVILKEVARHLEDAETSKLSHFFAAQRFETLHRYYIGLPTTIAALLLSWLVAQKSLAVNEDLLFAIKIILSLIVAVSTGISTFLNFNGFAAQHRKAALRYQEVWRKCKNWDTDFPDDTDLSLAKSRVQEYRDSMTNINQESPQIPRWAWKSVEKQIKEGSTNYDIEKTGNERH